jgi:hypothetical protein
MQDRKDAQRTAGRVLTIGSELKGKVALVTGADLKIGRAIALGFAGGAYKLP